MEENRLLLAAAYMRVTRYVEGAWGSNTVQEASVSTAAAAARTVFMMVFVIIVQR